METVCDELIRLLPREELEAAVRKLNLEVAELKDEVKFWRCRAEESSVKQGKVLNRSSISEEMLNELNNLANKMDVLRIMDDGSNKENDGDFCRLNRRLSIIKSSPPPLPSSHSNPNSSQISSSTKENSTDLNFSQNTDDGSRTVPTNRPKNILMKKAPPKMMSRADFLKKSEQKSYGELRKGAGSSDVSAPNKINSDIKKGSSRISLQWGCLTDEFPKFDSNVEERLFRDYFKEFDEKLSVLVSEKESGDEPKIELNSCSVFSADTPSGDLEIPGEKLFEWFVKKESMRSGNGTLISSQVPSGAGSMSAEGGKQAAGEAVISSNRDKCAVSRTEHRVPEPIGSEARTCIFGSKTSRMLQITINYFKKKVPKAQQKNLDFFKRSILQCTLDKEGVNLLLETVPDPFENAAKYEAWRECVNSVERYLEEGNSRDTLFEEEEFVYFLSRIPNLSKRLECMILRSSFEQLYCESLKWIEEKIRGLELILRHQKLPLLFKAVIDSRNTLNSRMTREGQSGSEKVRFIPLSSMKKLQSLKSPNIQGKTLLNFISSIVGEVFTAEETSVLKKSSEKSINMVYTMTTDLIFSWLELRDGSEGMVFAVETPSNNGGDMPECVDEFQNIMGQFYSERYGQMIRLCKTFKHMLRLYVASCYYFGDVSTFLPLGAKTSQSKLDLVETLLDLINKYNGALKQETSREGENNSPKSVEDTPRNNINKLMASSTVKARRLSHISDMKNILNPDSSSKSKGLQTQSLKGSLVRPKANIQQLFAKSIVRELNLKPLFNKGADVRSDRHVSFSDAGGVTVSAENKVRAEVPSNHVISEETNSSSSIAVHSEDGDSSFIDDIEKTVPLSMEPLFDQSHASGYGSLSCSEGNIPLRKRQSILELSEEAKEILSRNKTSSLSLSLSSLSDDGDQLDDDNETVALSSPSYTRLLDIDSMMESSMAENGESLGSESKRAENGCLKKKVVIMADDYSSPVKDNTRFNRRQSIRRICQMATYLDNNSLEDEVDDIGGSLENAFSRYKSPMVFRKPQTPHSPVASVEIGASHEAEASDHGYDPDFDYENSKTCVLNDILDVGDSFEETSHPGSNKENCLSGHRNYLYDIPQQDAEEFKTIPEYSPQKITFTRKSGRFGGTQSPPYD
ncbi:putative FH2 formin homology domain [Cryptosporidium canis]|uniref:FH2 formin homology domain n=1 Tax=Cryptosporidium canis TaxID=195482 RepID=A0ABQ8PCI3_9CRYT|nr:putative FH2 formin homology domain [Cryptosporidium canis]